MNITIENNSIIPEFFNNTIPEIVYIDKYPEEMSNDRVIHKINDKLFISKFTNVSKYSLEFLIETIIEQNSNYQIYKFEYLEGEQLLFIYSDSPANTQDIWYKRISKSTSIFDYPGSSNKEKLLEELDMLLNGYNPCPKDSIPFSTIISLLNKRNKEYQKQKNLLTKRLLHKLKKLDSNVKTIEYELHENIMIIYFYFRNERQNTTIKIQKKQDGTIIIEDAINNTFKNILKNAYSEIKDYILLILNIQKLNDSISIFSNCNYYIIEPKQKNGNFTIIQGKDTYIVLENFDLKTLRIIDSDNLFPKIFASRLRELLDKLYVRIDLCPEPIREELFQIRQAMDNDTSLSLRPNVIQKILRRPISLFRGFSEENKNSTVEPETSELLLIDPPKSDATLPSFLESFKTQQQKIQEQNEVERTEKELLNIINYLTYQNQENKYDINDLDINNFINYSLLKSIVNLRNVTRLTIININDKLFLDVESDSKNITIDNNNPLYNILLHYIYNNLELFSKNNLLIRGISVQTDHNIPFIDNKYHNNDLKTNIDKLETIRNFLFERRPFEYNSNTNYKELLNIKGRK